MMWKPALAKASMLERPRAGLKFRIVRSGGHEHANTPHLLALLRARPERPGRRCATQKRDELAPSDESRHLIPPAGRAAYAVFLMRQVDRGVLPLRVALEHAFQRELAADAAFFVTAVGMTWALTEALVHLNPTSLDRVCRTQSPADCRTSPASCSPCLYSLRVTSRRSGLSAPP